MYKINYSLIAGIIATALISSGCADEDALQDPGNTVSNSGTVSQTHFFIALDDRPTIFDQAENTVDLNVEVAVTATIADRNNQLLTNSHTVFFETEWGIIEPSCVTVKGQCSVTWIPSGNLFPADNTTLIVAYTNGEEAFLDPNGNGTYDDGETFFDVEEPWINIDSTEDPWVYDVGVDIIIDTINANDFTASNEIHDPADGLFNGQGCTHSAECSTVMPSTAVWNVQLYDITGGTVAPGATYNVNVDVTGLLGADVIFQQSGGDDLTVTADGISTFATAVADGGAYAVTVLTHPTGPRQLCIVTGGSGTISSADVTATVTCTNSYTISGNVTGTAIPNATILTLQNNGGDDIVLNDVTPTAFTFATPLADGSNYDVKAPAIGNTTGLTCTITGGSNVDGTGTLAGVDVTDIDVNCI
jgi:hypothetical protein